MVLLVIFVVVAPLAYFLYDPTPIRYENFDQISDAMTEDEVEKLLGCPPGDYRRTAIEYDLDTPVFPPFATEQRWMGSKGDIVIFRDAENRITGKMRIHGRREPPVIAWTHYLWDTLRGR